MSDPEYVSLESGTIVPPSYEPHHQTSPTAKRPALASICAGARSSYRKTSGYARESLISAKFHYEDARDFTKRTDWKHATKDIIRASPAWMRHSFWPIARYCLFHLLALFMPVGMFVCLMYVIRIPGLLATGADTCLPDGSFSIAGQGYYSVNWDAWSIDGIFQITVGFGHFRFTIAKLLDVIFDIVVGRGVQALFAAISYLVFTQSIQMTMETAPVAYGTFEAVNFNAASASQVMKLVRNIATNHGIRGKLRIFWMICASMFVVAFSTLASAMSGYSARQTPRFTVPTDNTSILLEQLYTIPFYIHDFWRLNLSTPYVLTPTTDFYTPSDPCSDANYDYADDGSSYTVKWVNKSSTCDLLRATYFYAFTYGINATKKVEKESRFYVNGSPVNISSPLLNITSTWFDVSYSDYFENPLTNTSEVVPNLDKYDDWSQATFIYNDTNTTYSYETVQKNGQCTPLEHAAYEWGFSFLSLFITTLLTFIWSVGTYAMWLDTHLHSRYNRAGRQMGTYRAALDLANAIRKDMGHEATERLSNAEIKALLERRGMNGNVIAYSLVDLSSPADGTHEETAPGGGSKGGAGDEPDPVDGKVEAQQKHGDLPLTRWESFKLWHRFRGWPTWTWKQRTTRIFIPVTALVIVIVVPIVIEEMERRADYY